jgi:hypothetical protein
MAVNGQQLSAQDRLFSIESEGFQKDGLAMLNNGATKFLSMSAKRNIFTAAFLDQ